MKLSYTVVGLFVGLFLGSLLGLGESSYTKKSQRESTVSVLTIAGAFFGALVGAIAGHKLGVKSYIEEKTGVANAKTDFQKDGRYWVGETYWTDTRERDNLNRLETKRIGKGLVVTTLNSIQIHVHSTESASRDSISKCHNSVRQSVFNKIIDTFAEDKPHDLERLFEQ